MIAGAGIIGLSIAIELASTGVRVTVLDRGRAMSEASWAAAGMLAGHDPENPGEMANLAGLSLSLYPDYLARIESLSGRKVPLRTHQTLQGSSPGQSFHHVSTKVLRRTEIDAIAPELTDAGREFLKLEEQSLDPRDICASLPRAAVAAGVKLVERCRVEAVLQQNSSVIVETSSETHSAAHFLNCCGAWSGDLPGLRGEDVGPRKGQMIAVRLSGSDDLGCVIRTPEIYLVPRGDGRVIVGATVERAGFDKTVHPGASQELLENAAALWPPIARAEIVESWAGLRPGTPDDLPLLGDAGQPNCWTATGHFRNGIMLAPGTARVMARLIRGEQAGIDLFPFAPGRFTGAHPTIECASDNYSTAAL